MVSWERRCGAMGVKASWRTEVYEGNEIRNHGIMGIFFSNPNPERRIFEGNYPSDNPRSQ